MTNFLTFIIYLTGMTIIVIICLAGKVHFGLLFLVPLLPLQNIILRLQQFSFGKDLNDIILIAMIFGWLFRSINNRERLFEPSIINKILFIMFIYTFISLWRGSSFLGFPAPFSASDVRVQTWKNYIILPLLYFITLNNIKTFKQMKWLIFAMIFSMLLMSFFTIKQFTWITDIASKEKLRGTFVWLGPNELAAFYASYTFVLLGILLFNKANIIRILFTITIIINMFCVLFLYSRGAYLGVLAGLLFLCFIKNKKLIIPLIILLFFWQAMLPKKVVQRINETKTEEGTLDHSSAARLELWKSSIDLFSKNPITGVGFNVFSFLEYQNNDPHNIYLKILAEQGIVGLIILLLIFWFSLKSGWELYRKSEDRFLKGLGFGFAACVIVTMTTNLFGDRWTYLQVGAFYWVFLGLVVKGTIITLKLNRSKK